MKKTTLQAGTGIASRLSKYLAALLLPLAISGLTGCAAPVTAPGLAPSAAQVDLIPVRDFVANRASKYAYALSPDGRKLAWLGVQGVSIHLFVQDLDSGRTLILPLGYIYSGFTWARDSRHLLFTLGSDAENQVLVRLDTASGEERPNFYRLTPARGVVAWLVSRPLDDPDHVLVAHNQRDKTVFDLYRVHLLTGEQTLLAQNPGDVKTWVTDARGRPAGRIVKRGEGAALVLDPAGPNPADAARPAPAPVYAWSDRDDVGVLSLSERGDRLYLLSNQGRDRVALLEIDTASGAETVLHADPRVDVSDAYLHPATGRPLMAHAEPDHPAHTRLDPLLPEDFGLPPGPADVRILSSDDALRRLLISRTTDKGQELYLYDLARRQPTKLADSPSLAFKDALADVRPVSFTSRDGVPLHGYLTLPRNPARPPHPLVLQVHGGPWERDLWRYDAEVQFLANRGYAVLQVNFRGSSGYGRRFQELAIGEFAGRMQDDLLDGVQWAIAQGHADPARIAISGGSYGGYAALVGLTATPETFACGIDLAGPTDLVKLVEDFPVYWKLQMDQWHRYVGDPAREADRAAMRARSPLFQAERIVRPLMVVQGGQDVRVRPDQSLALVQRLREQRKAVDFWLIPQAGHGVAHWPLRLQLFRKTEDFLAGCLGGRSGGFDYYQLGAWLF